MAGSFKAYVSMSFIYSTFIKSRPLHVQDINGQLIFDALKRITCIHIQTPVDLSSHSFTEQHPNGILIQKFA